MNVQGRAPDMQSLYGTQTGGSDVTLEEGGEDGEVKRERGPKDVQTEVQAQEEVQVQSQQWGLMSRLSTAVRG